MSGSACCDQSVNASKTIDCGPPQAVSKRTVQGPSSSSSSLYAAKLLVDEPHACVGIWRRKSTNVEPFGARVDVRLDSRSNPTEQEVTLKIDVRGKPAAAGEGRSHEGAETA